MINGGKLMKYNITVFEGNKNSKTFVQTKVCRAKVAPIELIKTLIDMNLIRVGDLFEAGLTYKRDDRKKQGIYKGEE